MTKIHFPERKIRGTDKILEQIHFPKRKIRGIERVLQIPLEENRMDNTRRG